MLLFNPADTKKSDITMALGQMFLGFQKRRLLYRLKKKITEHKRNAMASALGNVMFG